MFHYRCLLPRMPHEVDQLGARNCSRVGNFVVFWGLLEPSVAFWGLLGSRPDPRWGSLGTIVAFCGFWEVVVQKTDSEPLYVWDTHFLQINRVGGQSSVRLLTVHRVRNERRKSGAAAPASLSTPSPAQSPDRAQPTLYPLSQTLVAHSFFPLKRRGVLSCGLREIIGDSVVIQKGNRRATDSER